MQFTAALISLLVTTSTALPNPLSTQDKRQAVTGPELCSIAGGFSFSCYNFTPKKRQDMENSEEICKAAGGLNCKTLAKVKREDVTPAQAFCAAIGGPACENIPSAQQQ